MKSCLIALLLSCACFFCAAQPSQKLITFKGSVYDSVANKPVGYVTISLQNAATHAAVKGTLTKDDGGFELKAAAGSAYELVTVFVGYQNKSIKIPAGTADIDLGKIMLSPATQQLKGVSVTAARPIVKQEIDRISYDVQADPESKSQTALDMMRKLPLVTVDASDNIQLKGNSSYKIFINGKPSSLLANNPGDVLKAMPASGIQKIEVITTPPAKYDAEGLAGIINIVTNKKIDQGYNASINLRENSLFGPGGGASLTLKQGKFGFSMFTGYNHQNKRIGTSQSKLQTFGTFPSLLNQEGSTTNNGRFLFNSDELSFEIDTLNLVTATVNYNNGKFYSSNNVFSQTTDASDALLQSYRQLSNNTGGFRNLDLSLNYQLGFKRSKDQLLTMSYKFSNTPNDQNNIIDIFDRYNYYAPSLMQTNNTGTHEHTAQIDYVQPLKKDFNLEAGLKAIFRNNFSDFQTDNLDTVTNTYITRNDNNFTYHQDVYSFYNTYQHNFGDWGFKAGARVEHTSVSANFITQGVPLKQGYTNIIPSISIQRKFKNQTSFNFGFTNRIQRPAINQLNPFVDSTNAKFITTGNPNLRPVLNHTFELNYSKFSKGSLNLGLSYSFANNTIQSVTGLRDTITYTTFQNLGSDRKLGFNISVNYPLTKKLNLNVNGTFSYVWLKGYLSSQLYNNSGFQGYAFTFASYKITDTWRASVNAGFFSSNVLLQGKSSPFVFSSVSTSKDVLNKKASVFLFSSNPFSKFRRNTTSTRDVDFYSTNINEFPFRSFGVGFNYRFGKLNSNIKKNKRGIDNDDLKKSDGNAQPPSQ